jgi:hypothetical protein
MELDSYLAEQRDLRRKQDFAAHCAQTPLALREHLAFRMSPNPVAPSIPCIGANRTEWQMRCLAFQTFDRLKIADRIDQWTDKMRNWLVRMIIAPLNDDIRVVDAFFAEQNAQVFQCSSPLSAPHQTATPPPAPLAFSSLINPAPPQPTTREAFLVSTEKNPAHAASAVIVRKRLFVEKCIEVTRLFQNAPNEIIFFNPETLRRYVLMRIKDFSVDPYLGRFQYDGGKDYVAADGRIFPWQGSNLPTDSALLLHLFCTFMDEYIPHHGSLTFIQRHVADSTDPSRLKERFSHTTAGLFIAHEVAHGRPYFCVLARSHYRDEAVCYDTLQGRNTLFQAIVIFLFLVRKQYNSILDSFDIAKPPLQLMETIP